MKQLIMVFVFLFLGEISYSQIITASSRPVAGDVFQYKTDTIYIDTNTTGVNVTWDFSTLILPDSILYCQPRGNIFHTIIKLFF